MTEQNQFYTNTEFGKCGEKFLRVNNIRLENLFPFCYYRFDILHPSKHNLSKCSKFNAFFCSCFWLITFLGSHEHVVKKKKKVHVVGMDVFFSPKIVKSLEQFVNGM